MKLAARITLSMVALLGVLFAIGGSVMVTLNFERSLGETVARDAALHQRQKETLREALAAGWLQDGRASDYALVDAAKAVAAAPGEGGSLALLADGANALYNGLPASFTTSLRASFLQGDEAQYFLHREGEATYLVFPSKMTAAGRSLALLSAFDVSALFAERARQQFTFYAVYAILLLATVLLSLLLSRRITRPLHRLQAAAGEIAAGDYARRTGIGGDDEIGRLAGSFNEMAAAVEEKVASLHLSVRQKEDFIGAFTHELKTPMTAMMGYAALLRQSGAASGEQRLALDYIHSETRRLESLSQKLLALLGLAEEAIVPGPVRLCDLFARTKAALGDTGDCEVAFAGHCTAAVRGDVDLLVVLLLNLIRNAIGARPRDKQVRVEVALDGGGYLLSVSDSGCGIPPGELARIEEPFYRLDAARARQDGGSGLGLAIAARITELHGTRLVYESEVGAGTTVRLWLPGWALPHEEEKR